MDPGELIPVAGKLAIDGGVVLLVIKLIGGRLDRLSLSVSAGLDKIGAKVDDLMGRVSYIEGTCSRCRNGGSK